MFNNPFHSPYQDLFNDLVQHEISHEGDSTESLFPHEDVQDVHDDPCGHFVHPHEVHDYVRADGTHVDGYWRDGDGDTTIDRTVDDGGGYIQSNPDHDLFNNFD